MDEIINDNVACVVHEEEARRRVREMLRSIDGTDPGEITFAFRKGKTTLARIVVAREDSLKPNCGQCVNT